MTSHSDPLRIGILGTGTFATALAAAWSRAGHTITVAGRSRTKAEAIGHAVAAPAELASASDIVLVAIAYEGLEEALALTGGTLAGIPVIDATNPVDFRSGRVKPATGSAAEHVAAVTGAHVVKALNLFAGASWLAPSDTPRTVALCGDDPTAVELTARLIADLGGTPAVRGGLDRARQLEEVAGFVTGLVATGHDPATAIPSV